MLQDLELPPEVMQPQTTATESAAFAAPTPGVPASQRWLQKGNLAADHVAAGAFDSAMRLLNRSALLALSFKAKCTWMWASCLCFRDVPLP